MNEPQILALFSQPVYINMERLPQSIIDAVGNTEHEVLECNDSLYSQNGLMSKDRQWLSTQPETRELVEKHLDHYVYETLGIARERCQLIHQSSWCNMHTPGHCGAGHCHTNSMFSGVLYTQIPENSGTIRFHIPNMFPTYVTQTVLPDIRESNIYNMREAEIQPQEGMILCFPSHLNHTIGVHEGVGKRFSMAFNYFMKGAFGYDDNALTL